MIKKFIITVFSLCTLFTVNLGYAELNENLISNFVSHLKNNGIEFALNKTQVNDNKITLNLVSANLEGKKIVDIEKIYIEVDPSSNEHQIVLKDLEFENIKVTNDPSFSISQDQLKQIFNQKFPNIKILNYKIKNLNMGEVINNVDVNGSFEYIDHLLKLDFNSSKLKFKLSKKFNPASKTVITDDFVGEIDLQMLQKFYPNDKLNGVVNISFQLDGNGYEENALNIRTLKIFGDKLTLGPVTIDDLNLDSTSDEQLNGKAKLQINGITFQKISYGNLEVNLMIKNEAKVPSGLMIHYNFVLKGPEISFKGEGVHVKREENHDVIQLNSLEGTYKGEDFVLKDSFIIDKNQDSLHYSPFALIKKDGSTLFEIPSLSPPEQQKSKIETH